MHETIRLVKMYQLILTFSVFCFTCARDIPVATPDVPQVTEFIQENNTSRIPLDDVESKPDDPQAMKKVLTGTAEIVMVIIVVIIVLLCCVLGKSRKDTGNTEQEVEQQDNTQICDITTTDKDMKLNAYVKFDNPKTLT